MIRIAKRAETDGPQGLPPLRGVPPRISGLMRARGIRTDAEAQAYLHPSPDQRHDPFALHDMGEAVRILTRARDAGQRFVVYGDYDVDGICATAIMVQALRSFGIRPAEPAAFRIPDRHEEGYGLNMEAVRSLIGRTDLLVTVDCGITSVEEVALAKAGGLTVIVTDHHSLPDTLPAADAVIDPLMAPYPFPGLCGAGVAYQLCRALLGEAAAQDCLDLAALATVADMVPLRDENRYIVSAGLEAIEHTRRPGLRALMTAAGCRFPMTSEQIAFALAPRMNACGRLSTALTAVRLLFEGDPDEAAAMAQEMNRLNENRKNAERQVIDSAKEQVSAMDLCRLRALVVSGAGYDSGVVGLAAGRLAEQYGYPTVVLAENPDGMAVGSARSVPGVNIYQALKTCEDLFQRFGGHPQAAGLTLKSADIPALRERLSDAVRAQIGLDAVLMPTAWYDDELPLEEVNQQTVDALRLMEPFGMGNTAPVFLLRGAELLTARGVGLQGAHLKCELGQGDTRRAGIAFRYGYLAGRRPDRVDVLFSPTRNEFRGSVSYECQISRMIPTGLAVRGDEQAEAAAILRDMARALALPDGAPAAEAAEEDSALPEQGVLVLCRTAETLRQWQRLYPALDIHQERYDDPCAFTALAGGLPLDAVTAPYRLVILADGDLTGRDAQLVRRACPLAQVRILPMSAALKARLAAYAIDRETLVPLYRALSRVPGTQGIGTLAREAGLSVGRTVAGLSIFHQMGLVEFDLENGSWRKKPEPAEKRNLNEVPLYRLLMARKEERKWPIPHTTS